MIVNNTTASPWRFITKSFRVTRDNQLSFLLVLPASIYMLLVVFYPLVLLIWIGFTNQRIGETGHWIGFDNFIRLLSSTDGQSALLNTIRYAIVGATGGLILGLAIALLLNGLNTRYRFLEALLVLPWAIPPTVTALLWLWMFYDIGGVFNWTLTHLGLISAPISWLGLGSLAKISVLIPNIWRLTPFFTICLLSARSNLEVAPYEAAALDGAGAPSQFLYVTLPGLYRTVIVTFAFAFLWSATEFPLVYVLTRGGPANSTHVLGTLSYDLALRGGTELGLGAACALLLIPFSTLLAFAVWTLGSWRRL